MKGKEDLSLRGLCPFCLAEFNPLKEVVEKSLFVFSVGPWRINVSNVMFMVTLAGAALLILIPLAVRQNKSLALRGMRNLVEAVCVFFREEVVRPILGENTDRYIGFIWTLFFFILTLNLLSLIPTQKILTLVTGKENDFGGAATANIWITGSLAALAFIMTIVSGIRQQGLVHYIINLAPPAPWWISPVVYVLEILSTFIRPFTLAIRLFANMVGGHMVLATLIGLIIVFRDYGAAFSYGFTVLSVVFSIFISLLELLVAFIQAYIFALLCALYIGLSITSEH